MILKKNCGIFTRYPDKTNKRVFEGGLRLQGILKKSQPNKPLVSVITTVFNCKDHIEQAILSVLEQTYDNIEYILIDATSTDGTLDTIKRFQNKIDYILSEPDRGMYDGINKGIACSQGDFIIILNADDFYVSNAIEDLVRAATKSKADVTMAHSNFISNEGKLVRKETSILDDRIFLKNTTRHETMLVTKEAYNKFGVYNPNRRIISDWEWIVNAYRERISTNIIDKYILNFRITGMSGGKLLETHDSEKIDFLKKLNPNFKAKDIGIIRYPNNCSQKELIYLLNKYQKNQNFASALNIFLEIKKNQKVSEKNEYVPTKKLKLIFVIWELGLSRMGFVNTGVDIANEMSRRGHDCSILYSNHGKYIKFQIDKSIKLIPASLYDWPIGRAALRKKIKSENPDVCILFNADNSLLAFTLVLENLGIPVLVSEQNCPGFIENISWNKAQRQLCMKMADSIHLVSEKFRKSLPLSVHDRIKIIPNHAPAIAVYVNRNPEKEKEKIILAVGSFKPYKQHKILIDAFSLLEKEFPDWELKIIGEGELKDYLNRIARDLNLNKKVKILNTPSNMSQEYLTASIFCQPSRLEGFPRAILEAMSHKLPAIGFSACPGVNEIIINNENGLLAPEMTADCLAQSLKCLMLREEIREKYAENALISMQRYNKEKCFNDWEQLLTKTASLRHCTKFLTHKKEIDFIKLSIKGKIGKIYGWNKLVTDLKQVYNEKIVNNRPTVSIQVPVYNAQEHLSECLNSILNQTFTDFEVICVDDGSTDNSLAILKEFEQRDKRIKIFRHKNNMGTLQARKTAFEKANGKYMAFIDADDVADQGMIKNLVGYARSTNSDFVQCCATVYDPKKVLPPQIYDRYNNYFSNIRECTLESPDVFPNLGIHIKQNLWISLFSKDIYKKIIKYIPLEPLPHGNDNYLMFMLTYFATRYSSLNKILYKYRASNSSSNLTIPDVNKVKEHISSRSKALTLVKNFMTTRNDKWDEEQPPFQKFRKELIKYNYTLMTRCISKNPKARKTLEKYFKAHFPKFDYEGNKIER